MVTAVYRQCCCRLATDDVSVKTNIFGSGSLVPPFVAVRCVQGIGLFKRGTSSKKGQMEMNTDHSHRTHYTLRMSNEYVKQWKQNNLWWTKVPILYFTSLLNITLKIPFRTLRSVGHRTRTVVVQSFNRPMSNTVELFILTTYNNIPILIPSYINDILNGALLNLLTNAPISR